ncbi:MAG: hypothetical protein PF487_11340 [Bacteroidales bacterium]|jgi:hypothetical protein|nr:hypothetical protein [Bacteroidales bacterium]
MKYLFFILSIMFFLSCNKDDSEQFIIDTAINISVKDAEGNDLLNSNSSNSLNQNVFKVIYEINGEQIEINDENLDYPKGFFVYQHENEYRIRVFPNTAKNTSYPITYIQWSEIDTDTLKCEIDSTESSEICKKVWLNNELVWQAYDTERFFEIMK